MAHTRNHGLIHGYLLDGKGGALEMDWPAIQAWSEEKGVRWLHFDYSDSHIEKWLTAESGLKPLISEALLAEDPRPRATLIDDGLLIALRGINHNPGAEPEDMVSIRLWLTSSQIISTGKRDLRSVKDMVADFSAKKGVKNAGEFIVDLSDYVIWRMTETLENLDDEISATELEVLSFGGGELRGKLTEIRLQAVALKRYLAPERDALNRIQIEKVTWLSDHHRLQLKEITDRLIRHIEDLDEIRERAAIAHDELGNKLSEQLNRRMYMLAIVTIVFLPLGFLTGLLGVNIAGIPGAQNPNAFNIFLGLIFAVIFVQLILFKFKKWF
ncbi:Mg2 transporter protein CorA family protein [Chloroherpeton thalassium ATCC 35110]|uniref:Mg2 transporter protein CorA family protein n=1 Tax=Chloroherpeton thalassium (strain ATCC 35110 / GB-78) TaxID=517418 RepID=B3QSX2_CHLT3|nr:zinc transporter ZntB [Chloroherpeton thalassium]ACF12615.1 Mg2 transporter protein CorA family protein [Chloroherpeton thalassium ATCC 35110]